MHDHGHHDPLETLKRLLIPERDWIWVVAIYGLFVGMLSLVVPVGVQALVNSVAFGSLLQPLVVLTTLVFAALAMSGFLQILQIYTVELLQCRIFTRSALKAADALLTDDLSERLDGRPKTSVSRFLEIASIQKNVAVLLVDGVSLTLQIGIGMTLLAFYHPYLLAFDILLSLALASIVWILGKNALSTSIAESAEKYNVLGHLENIQRNPISFRSTQGRDFALNIVDKGALRYLRTRRKHFRILAQQAVGTFSLQALASAILLGVGGWLVISSQLTLGQLVAAELVLTAVLTSLSKLPKYFEGIYDLVASADKLSHILELTPEREIGRGSLPQPTRAGPVLAMKNVSYNHPCGAPNHSSLDLTLERGQSSALYGPTGSGKSAILELIMRIRAPHSGHCELYGIDTRDISLGELREGVMLLREHAFIDGTITENVALWKTEHHGHRTVKQCLELSGLIDHVTALPDGANTRISPTGAPMRDSEKVQLLIAKALFHQPAVVLIDKLFDVYDDATRAQMVKALSDGLPSSAVLIATERPDIANLCSKTFKLALEGSSWRIKA